MTALEPKAGERYLILAPHPDDETLAAGGLIQRAVRASARVKILYLTNGERNIISAMFYYKKPFPCRSDLEGLGCVRRKEAFEAAGILGLSRDDLHFLGYPDLGMLSMRDSNDGGQIVSDLKEIFDDYRPSHVIVPHERDGHADHRAASFFLNEALREYTFSMEEPRLLFYQVHKGFGAKGPQDSQRVYRLTDEERELKRRAILSYRSQIAYRRRFLVSFAASFERFKEVSGPALKRLDFAGRHGQY